MQSRMVLLDVIMVGARRATRRAVGSDTHDDDRRLSDKYCENLENISRVRRVFRDQRILRVEAAGVSR